MSMKMDAVWLPMLMSPTEAIELNHLPHFPTYVCAVVFCVKRYVTHKNQVPQQCMPVAGTNTGS